MNENNKNSKDNLKGNRSSYTTDENGELVADKSVDISAVDNNKKLSEKENSNKSTIRLIAVMGTGGGTGIGINAAVLMVFSKAHAQLDGNVNAAKKVNTTPQINITGGYLEVNLNPSGDTDGIDSNGTYTQSGGVVVAKGPNSQMAAALDSDGTAKITGGTIIILGALGEKGLSTSGVSSKSLSLHSSGSHTITIDGVSYTFTNAYSYSKTICYSSVSVSA